MRLPRDEAARLGRETLEILRSGSYVSPGGRRVDVAALVEEAVRRTTEYPPDHVVDADPDLGLLPRISVENEPVLAAGRRLSSGGPIAALTFASATSPGGGFLNGALAQEETIARSSGLHACLHGRAMYAFHRSRQDAMYTDYVIHSPEVPVFRTDGGELLEEPWLLSILTCPAANVTALRRYAPQRIAEVPEVMTARAEKLLAVAVRHGHRRLILGAWGCGAFGIEPRVMAGIFHDLLATRFSRAFDLVVFAITDWSEELRFIGPFREAFVG